jgi:crotonobetaine/carnitine-CoA ligase
LQLPHNALKKIVVASQDYAGERSGDLEIYDQSALEGNVTLLRPLDEPIHAWDLQSIIYTSGTTGRSKGVLSSYMHCYSALNPDTWTCTRADDRQLLHMPIFHIGGAFMASTALCVGDSIGVIPAFKTDTFWQSVRKLGVTSVFLLGSMATFLLKQPPDRRDRDHGLRHVMIVPIGTSGPAFRERFDVNVFTLFNMTEISSPLMSSANPTNVCGRIWSRSPPGRRARSACAGRKSW